VSEPIYGVTARYRRDVSRVEQTIRFSRGHHDSVVSAMKSLDASGEGWINIGPWLSDEVMAEVPVRTGLGAWFSGRGPQVPMATWMPSNSTGRRTTAAQVGVEHGSGPNALARLREAGHAMPEGWVPRQDHGKHGIVAELPTDVVPDDVIDWLIVAITGLSDLVPVGAHWRAVVHRPD